MRLIAPRGSRRAFEVRDLLERNLIPVRWYDVDTDEESAAMLDWLQIPREETPVLVRNTAVLRNPSAAQVARELGLRAEVDGERFDLVVLGGGPAGLASAVYAGSEGLRTLVTEAWAPGGQAGMSTRIENYLGFPTGISGTELTRKATLQARRFDAVLSSFHRVVELARGAEGLVRVDLDDGQHALARTVVVATGARWRTLAAEGVERFTGAGVYHAAMPTDAERCRGEDVIVVGGGNSAGQAALHLARAARSVRVVIRGDGLAATMSRYLVERIEARPNIELVTGTEIAAVHGDGQLEDVDLRNRADGSVERVAVPAVFVMIGADPCTEAVHLMLELDAAGYITLRRRRGGLRGTEPLACDGPAPASARDGLAGRLRRGRRARRRDQARRRSRRRRGARRALRPSGPAGLVAARPRLRVRLRATMEPLDTPRAHPPRKVHGIHYTPAELARFVARRALAGLGRRPLAILDPACGDGELLLAAALEAVAAGLPAPRLVGIDRDPAAVAVAAERLRTAPAAASPCAAATSSTPSRLPRRTTSCSRTRRTSGRRCSERRARRRSAAATA